MTASFLRRRSFTPMLAALVAAIALMLPAAAHANIIIGAESNGKLVNSDRTPAQQAAELDRMQAAGVQLVRGNVGWNEMAGNCGGETVDALKDPNNPCYTWGVLDSLISLAKARNMQVLLSFTRAPQWLQNSTNPIELGVTGAQFQHTIDHYSAFMTAAGTRYNASSSIGFVKYWTIWNEPNGFNYWARPNAQRYAMLYGSAAVALKTANPGALIAAGPTAPQPPVSKGGIMPLTFMVAFQKYLPLYLPKVNPKQYINAWAHNPYPGYNSQPSTVGLSKPPKVPMWNVGILFPYLDAKPITRGLPVWATEFGWETKPEPTVYTTTAKQAQFIAEAFDWLYRKKRITIGIQYGMTDPGDPADFQSGLFTPTGVKKPSFTMFQRMISVPKGVVKRGALVDVWGRANVAPTKGYLVMRLNGKGKWYLVPSQKRGTDGSIVARVRMSYKIVDFAVWTNDGANAGNGTYGMYRRVVGR